LCSAVLPYLPSFMAGFPQGSYALSRLQPPRPQSAAGRRKLKSFTAPHIALGRVVSRKFFLLPSTCQLSLFFTVDRLTRTFQPYIRALPSPNITFYVYAFGPSQRLAPLDCLSSSVTTREERTLLPCENNVPATLFFLFAFAAPTYHFALPPPVDRQKASRTGRIFFTDDGPFRVARTSIAFPKKPQSISRWREGGSPPISRFLLSSAARTQCFLRYFVNDLPSADAFVVRCPALIDGG